MENEVAPTINREYKDRLFKFIFGPDENVPLNKNCTPLYHYTKFISMITANIAAGMDNQKAVETAVDEAIKQELLGDFFKVNKAEVIGMCMTEFDEELAINTWRQDGRTEKAIETAVNMLKKNYPTSDISEITGLPLEKVLELQKESTVQA